MHGSLLHVGVVAGDAQREEPAIGIPVHVYALWVDGVLVHQVNGKLAL